METVEELREALTANGLDSDLVGRAGDRDLPLIDGVLLVRTSAAGSTVSTWERGRESDVRRYASEREAVNALASRLLERPPSRQMSDTERDAVRTRMQAKAQETLRRLADREDGEGS